MSASDQGSRPSLEAVRRFWESHVNNEYYTREERGSPAYFAEIERRRYDWHYHLRDLFLSLKGSSGRLLEIGCGIGVDSIQLARCGFDVTAIDLTEAALEVARQFARQRGVAIDFRLGNAESLPFDDGTFDRIYSFGVLHHTPRIVTAIGEVHRVLRPGGKALIMLYHRDSLVNLIHRLFNLPYESPRNLKDHCPVVYTFGRREVREMFSSFADVEVTTAYPFTFGFGRAVGWLPSPLVRLLGRLFGWHLMITAVR